MYNCVKLGNKHLVSCDCEDCSNRLQLDLISNMVNFVCNDQIRLTIGQPIDSEQCLSRPQL